MLLCSCADMYVTRTDVATPGGRAVGAIDAKDYGSKGVHMITNCGVGASNPSAIYIRPFCIDTAVFKGDEALSDGEMPIRKALAPVEFANDLKEQLNEIKERLGEHDVQLNQIYDATTGTVFSVEPSHDPQCEICSPAGLKGLGDKAIVSAYE